MNVNESRDINNGQSNSNVSCNICGSMYFLPKIKTLQQARHSGIQSDLLLQTKAQYQMKT